MKLRGSKAWRTLLSVRRPRHSADLESEEGTALVELAISLPIILTLLTGAASFSLAFYCLQQLGNATTTGVQLVAANQGLVTDPCETAAAAPRRLPAPTVPAPTVPVPTVPVPTVPVPTVPAPTVPAPTWPVPGASVATAAAPVRTLPGALAVRTLPLLTRPDRGRPRGCLRDAGRRTGGGRVWI